jgi:hypothetical protein
MEMQAFKISVECIIGIGYAAEKKKPVPGKRIRYRKIALL